LLPHRSRIFRRIRAGLCLPVLLTGCSSITGPRATPLPVGAVLIAAPAIYRDWSGRTEACSGLRADFSTVQWYVVPGVDTFSTEAGEKVGMWVSAGGTDRIVIAGNYQNHEMVVSHELLHHLLRQEGHPSEYFIVRCHLTWESWRAAGGGTIGG
jgi:hypothetical protein